MEDRPWAASCNPLGIPAPIPSRISCVYKDGPASSHSKRELCCIFASSSAALVPLPVVDVAVLLLLLMFFVYFVFPSCCCFCHCFNYCSVSSGICRCTFSSCFSVVFSSVFVLVLVFLFLFLFGFIAVLLHFSGVELCGGGSKGSENNTIGAPNHLNHSQLGADV